MRTKVAYIKQGRVFGKNFSETLSCLGIVRLIWKVCVLLSLVWEGLVVAPTPKWLKNTVMPLLALITTQILSIDIAARDIVFYRVIPLMLIFGKRLNDT